MMVLELDMFQACAVGAVVYCVGRNRIRIASLGIVWGGDTGIHL